MYYSIYPRLRVIFTYLPEQRNRRELIEAESKEDFISRVKSLRLLSRFPPKSNDLEEYFNSKPFIYSQQILSELEGSASIFFENYLKIYELEDIRNAISGRYGKFIFFTDDKYKLGEIGEQLEDTSWKESWTRGYNRYKENNDPMEIEFVLENYYYYILLDSLDDLSWSDRRVTESYTIDWIKLINQYRYNRLLSNYKLEDFEIKQYLINHKSISQDINKMQGLDQDSYKQQFYKLCYNTFKKEMFTMASLIAFFNIFRMEFQQLTAIYRGVIYNIKKDLINTVVGEG
ncbi:MAG: V-type ATPase subunit [Candidatus Marinimicrobia bacterium]|nr:V-type ATPase subunit [Candidatus Neomarinimicrobiota bacterium]